MKLYDGCLKSIELAYIQSGFPPRLRQKWAVRKATANIETKMTNRVVPIEVALGKTPFIINCTRINQKNYPVIDRMRSARISPSKRLWKDGCTQMNSCDREVVFANKKKAAQQEHHNKYPTKELALASKYYRHIVDLGRARILYWPIDVSGEDLARLQLGNIFGFHWVLYSFLNADASFCLLNTKKFVRTNLHFLHLPKLSY